MTTARWVALVASILVPALGCQGAQPDGTGSTSAALSAPAGTGPYSGQRIYGQVSVEPAVNDADGSTVFLLTPDHAPLPSKANGHGVAPLYLPVYPTTSAVDPATLNCQPDNCDHVNVLPFPAPGYVNGGASCTSFGLPANGCSLVLGHDHLIGKAPTGDFNVAWSVVLVVFTPQGIADGAADVRALTEDEVDALVSSGDAFEAPTPITFNCSITSLTTYLQGTPISL